MTASAREDLRNTQLDLAIGRWRRQRLDLRRHLMQLFSCELLASADADSDSERTLHLLCADLIDYVSTGHFEIYGRALQGRLDPSFEHQALLAHLLHTIGASTDAALAFNDRYENPLGSAERSHLADDLARLSRNLLLRFAVEEQLLDLAAA